MHFEQLNDDILLLILDFLELEAAETISEWKTNIPLIQVNRRWRRLASSITHKNALFETREINDDTSKVCTNFSIVTADYGFRHIQNLRISLNYYEYIPIIYKILYRNLVRYGSRLATTKSIIMNMLITGAYEEEDVNMQIMSRLSELITRVMPNVTDLELFDVETTVILEQFYGNLISGYRNQLTRLISRKGFTLPQDYSLSKPIHLYMDVSDNNPSSLSMFHVVADSLVELALRGVSAYFPWNRFGNNNNSDNQSPNSVTFGCLKRLDIYFLSYDKEGDNESELPMQPMTLHFPLLERMYVNNYSPDCEFLQHFVFPEHVETLRMLSSSKNFASLANSEIFLPKSNIFTLESSIDSDDEEEGVDMTSEYKSNAINSFLEKYHGSKQTRLASTAFYEFYPDSNVARLAKLSTIYLTRCEYMRTAVNVIEKVPGLVNLHVIADSEFEPLGFTWKDPLDKLEPFNTNIKELSLTQVYEDEKTKDSYLADAIYMILRIHSLRKLNVEDFSYQQIKAFVQENKEGYPHLARIHVSIGSYLAKPTVDG